LYYSGILLGGRSLFLKNKKNNMKRNFYVLHIFLVVCILLSTVSFAYADTNANYIDISAESAILIDKQSGRILYEKNKDQKMYPASITKCMTALIVLENCNLDDMVTVGDEIDLISPDSSKAGLIKGETISVSDLLMGLMLPSGNDAAYSLAVYTARKASKNDNLSIDESINYFVDMMNAKAAEIGAESTNFENVDGYHDDNHYTTADDLALIIRTAMENSTFREIVGTAEYVSENVTISNGNNSTIHNWINKNELIIEGSSNYLSGATGVKTGYTTPAGYCLASAVSQNGMNLIAVVLKSKSDFYRFNDSKALYQYAFDNFVNYNLCNEGEIITTVQAAIFKKGRREELNAVTESDLNALIKKTDISLLQKNITWDTKKILINGDREKNTVLRAPIKKGTHLGTVTYTLNGEIIAQTELLAENDVMDKVYFNIFISIINNPTYLCITLVSILILLLLIGRGKKRKIAQLKDEDEEMM